MEPFALRSAAVSECGRRALNEDAVLLAELPDGAELVAVADGMGGLAAGDVASRRALQVLHAALVGGSGLEEAVLAANAAVLAEADGLGVSGMGTTLVALLRRGAEYFIANVGDSRAYRVDETGVWCVTRDHSFVAEAVQSGHMTLDAASSSRWRNAVTRAVGTGPDLQVDCFGPMDATVPHAIVLCTDGFYRVVQDDALHEVVHPASDPGLAVQLLAGAALNGGADDNVTVAMIRFGPSPAGTHVEPAPAATTSAPRAEVPLHAAAAPAVAAAAPPVPRPAPAQPVASAAWRDGRRRRSRAEPHRRWPLVEAAAFLAAAVVLMAALALAGGLL